MKRVLFVAYDFPPCANVGGSIRSERFAKYLPDFGWIPTILALGPASGQEMYPNVQRIASATPWHWPYEVTPYGWSVPMEQAARRVLRDDPHAVIYASCPPFAHTRALTRVSSEFSLPLILDLRDAWALDPYVEGSRLKKFLHRHVFPTYEKHVFQRAHRILLNTPSALAAYEQRYPQLAERFFLLPNGFDEEDFQNADGAIRSPGPLAIVHIGRFGIGGRKPGIILDALRILRDENQDIRLRLIGSNTGGIDFSPLLEGLHDFVDVMPTIPHGKALAELQKADVALLYQEDSSSGVTPVAGKTHEYLRAGKPILAIAPPGDNLTLIQDMAGFARVVRQPADAASIARELRYLIDLKARDQLPIHSPPRARYLAEFSRRGLAAQLALHFDPIVQ